jgi:hypothetical protein
VRVVEPQGASIKVEQAREILRFLSLQRIGRARVVIIDQAHLLNAQAANALLKIVEEPPADVFFVLVTDQPSSLLPTVRSRAQLMRFVPLTDRELADVFLRLELPPPEPELQREARGSVEAALRLRDEAEALGEVKAAVAHFLASSPASFPGPAIARLRDACFDRPAALFAARTLQEIARDLARAASGVGAPADALGLSGLAREVMSAHPKVWTSAEPSMHVGLALGELALGVEHDLAGNVDRGLILENLWFDWARALGEVAS